MSPVLFHVVVPAQTDKLSTLVFDTADPYHQSLPVQCCSLQALWGVHKPVLKYVNVDKQSYVLPINGVRHCQTIWPLGEHAVRMYP